LQGFFSVLLELAVVLAALSVPVLRPRPSVQGERCEEGNWRSSGCEHYLSTFSRGGVSVSAKAASLVFGSSARHPYTRTHDLLCMPC
jgi:hypothetical protein